MNTHGHYIASYRDDDGVVYTLGEIEGNEALSLLFTLYALQPKINEWQKKHDKILNPENIYVEWIS